MYTFFFRKLTLKNSTVKRAYWRAILGWVTSWKISQTACERGRSMLKKACDDLWGQSMIFEAVIDKTRDREGSGHYTYS